jgi:hypothetical protein
MPAGKIKPPLHPASRVFGGVLQEHKHAVAGRPSTDRNNKATLPFTGPGRATKSSAECLSPREVKLQYANRGPPLLGGPPVGQLGSEAVAYSYSTTTRGADRPVPARILT